MNEAQKNKNSAEPTVTIDDSMYAQNPYSTTPEIRCDREQYIAHLVKTNGWTKGAELGVCKGRTFLFLLHACTDLTLVGVDLWAAQPNNKGREKYTRSPHAMLDYYKRLDNQSCRTD
jgi:hypothetical protein